jgi:hypothetical protein
MQVSIWFAFLALFVGGMTGVVIMCLVVSSGRADWERDEYEKRMSERLDEMVTRPDEITGGEPT